MTYPLPPPICHIKEEIPPTLLLTRYPDRLWQLRIFHHPLLQLSVPPPVSVVSIKVNSIPQNIRVVAQCDLQFVGRHLLHYVPRILIENGQQGLWGEALQLGMQGGYISNGICGRKREIRRNHRPSIGLNKR